MTKRLHGCPCGRSALVVTMLLAAALDAKTGTAAEAWSAKVIAVADGDTVSVLHNGRPVKLRLHGIDTPEKKQAFGKRAKQFTSRLVFGKVVQVKVAAKDRYGRQVAEVFINGRSLNQELVKAGLAWWYRKYAPKDKRLADLEGAARKARRGLWADASPTPPWTWRRMKRSPAATPTPSKSGPIHGNVRSKVYHRRVCRHFNCKRCAASFTSAKDAIAAGYRAHACAR